MASSKNARKITLPSFENAPSLDSGDFSGHSATSSASFANAQLWPKHLRRWILGVYEIQITLIGNRNRRPRAARSGRLYIGFRGDLNPVDTSNPSSNLYVVDIEALVLQTRARLHVCAIAQQLSTHAHVARRTAWCKNVANRCIQVTVIFAEGAVTNTQKKIANSGWDVTSANRIGGTSNVLDLRGSRLQEQSSPAPYAVRLKYYYSCNYRRLFACRNQQLENSNYIGYYPRQVYYTQLKSFANCQTAAGAQKSKWQVNFLLMDPWQLEYMYNTTWRGYLSCVKV